MTMMASPAMTDLFLCWKMKGKKEEKKKEVKEQVCNQFQVT